jgi:hypothetical protein
MDQRSDYERFLWDKVGPPLYYCADCLRAVTVEAVEGGEPIITRPCVECKDAGIIAPRKAIVAGKGGLSWPNKARMGVAKLAASVTGRCV